MNVKHYIRRIYRCKDCPNQCGSYQSHGIPDDCTLPSVEYVRTVDRKYRPCNTCIGTDNEGYMAPCWIMNNKHCKAHMNNPDEFPCDYHMTKEEYIELLDSLERSY